MSVICLVLSGILLNIFTPNLCFAQRAIADGNIKTIIIYDSLVVLKTDLLVYFVEFVMIVL